MVRRIQKNLEFAHPDHIHLAMDHMIPQNDPLDENKKLGSRNFSVLPKTALWVRT